MDRTDMAAGSTAGSTGASLRRALPLAGLVVLADVLFWAHPPGLSLALFAGAVLAAAGWHRPRAQLIGPAALLLAGALPVVEHVQPLSLAFLGAALTGAVVWAGAPGAAVDALLATATGLLRRLPLSGGLALVRGIGALRSQPTPVGGLRQALRDWAFPIGGTMVLAALLLDANPVLARLFDLRLDVEELLTRGLFWTGTALIVWPFLQPAEAVAPWRGPGLRLPGLGINGPSTLRALGMFNALLALQTGLDLSILAGGASLPPGMTYAAYAHRGAYPLLATALLAGAFALAARPHLGAHRLIRPLMLLWLGQNVVVALSALLRLDLYVASYGLTYLRIYAMIWIALVAVGLLLIGWQVLRGASTRWLVLRLGGLGLGTLYLCCFVNFAAVIAAQNLRRDVFDTFYVCNLGPMAAGVLGREAELCPCYTVPYIEGWRDWGFRAWRVARYAEAVQMRAAHDHPDR